VAWVPAVPALHQAGSGRPSHVDVPSRAVIVWSQGLAPLEGFAWHGCPRCLLYQAGSGRPSHVDVPSRAVIVWSQGLAPLEGFAWHGCPRCLLYFKQAPGGLLTSMSLRGLLSSRARGSPRSRVLLAWQGTGSLNASQSRLGFLQRGRAFLGAVAARARVVGGVAGERDGSPRPLQVFAVMMARLRRRGRCGRGGARSSA
jgi:hypothetical protein